MKIRFTLDIETRETDPLTVAQYIREALTEYAHGEIGRCEAIEAAQHHYRNLTNVSVNVSWSEDDI